MKKFYVPPNAPPPLSVQPYTNRTQKDSVEVESSPKRLTFDDLETREKAPQRTRQGDSMTTCVNTVVNKAANTPVYIPLSANTPQRLIASLPSDTLQVLHPGATLIDMPEELKMGLNTGKAIPISIDPNTVLECHSYR